ncbi:hypothetical protein L1987_47202 [Smallanthus sonchifolius]|uniref:Uncharacterized protein n=1 Tax=Smallanthus sonchifolius TaxID=185202 RepID=A0ACB9G3M7_9ASTR|nr:hypothetical protein L1987_47202 [Smallanthus sonchifolius]
MLGFPRTLLRCRHCRHHVLHFSLFHIKKPFKKTNPLPPKLTIPDTSTEIQETRVDPTRTHTLETDELGSLTVIRSHANEGDGNPNGYRISYPEMGGGSGDQVAGEPEVSHLGWGHWYTLRELEIATNGLSDENVIGEGGYGVVYYGVLADNTMVAVKNLLNNRGQAEKEFKVEVDAIGRVRHKNLVRLLGYCVEGAQRILVYEYANNGNLEQWLHGDVGSISPLTWEIRMNIILGTAKGYFPYCEPVNLVDWLKTMVTNRNVEGVLDPKLPEKPSSRALKRALLVALRCVDPSAQKRPTMGHVIHLLEADDFPFRDGFVVRVALINSGGVRSIERKSGDVDRLGCYGGVEYLRGLCTETKRVNGRERRRRDSSVVVTRINRSIVNNLWSFSGPLLILMQGQKGAIGSLPESLTFEHGSSSSDSGVVEQEICWTNFIRNPATDANQDTQNLSMWSMGESSSSAVPNQVGQNRVDPKIGHGWSSFVKDHPEPHQHEPPASRLSLGGVSMNTSRTHHGHNVTVNPSTFIGMKPSNYASSSSGPVEMEARQLPRKRKAAELNIGQSSSGVESSNILQRPEVSSSSSVWQSVSENPTPTNTMPFDLVIPRLGSGIGVSSDSRAAMENIRRNVRIRINNSSQQDQLPATNNNINNNGLLNFSAPYPSLGLNPVATTGDSSSSREGQPILRVPALIRNLHVSSRIRSSSSRANRPFTSNIIGGSGDTSRTMPTNISEHPLFVQPHDSRNNAQTAVNLNLDSVGGPTSLSSNSNPMPNLGPHRGSSLYRSRRHAEFLRRSLLSSIDSGAGGGGEQNSNLFSRIPPPVGASASASSLQEPGMPPVIAIAGRHPHHHHLPRLRTSDGRLDGAFGLPYLSRTVAGGSERRGRLVSEIRNVLDLIRRGEGLRFEDVMILDQSVLYGMTDIHDQHRDMRLDIDNMSYEELLALEERIGNVNTGLTEENVYKHLKHKTYASVAGQPDDEPCCICQEEYKNGDDLGALECGHEFHTSCIKQWLLQKNACPVCKSAASK